MAASPGWMGATYPPLAADPMKDLADEVRWAQRATWAVTAMGVLNALGLIGMAVMAGWFIQWFKDAVSTIDTLPPGSQPPTPFDDLSGGMFAAIGLIELTALCVFVGQVVFVIWFFHAANVAQRLGLPARRSPGWAAAGFFIPVVNLWFPYQSGCDLFAPGDPGRRTVGWWWGLSLGQSVLSLPIVIGALFSTAVAVSIAIVLLPVPLLTLLHARRFIELATDNHTVMLLAAGAGPAAQPSGRPTWM